ncbi:Kelch repeat-containing protein [Chitinophaga nivalis]|uniref:Galactose oxidase n=1 Tax=Chitinophaga nivalis TaxID=2991709 RepID=A0ABT3IQC7_9BACT|nr:hypothetical protein [Chitinophaga nivalis]MCW3464162.1 hypothetical protein [Chitinophaga nivalis]MCW3486148.1 hypothetical protein [Chitinophaga nivalis]
MYYPKKAIALMMVVVSLSACSKNEQVVSPVTLESPVHAGVSTASYFDFTRLEAAGVLQLSAPKSAMALASCGNKVFFAGGSDEYSSKGPDSTTLVYTGSAKSTVEIYDTLTHSWSIQQLSQARDFITAVTVGTKVLFAGGRMGRVNQYKATTVVDVYDVTTQQWSVTYLSEARAMMGGVAHGSKAYFFGGTDNNGKQSRKIDVYDVITNTWSALQLRDARREAGAVVRGNEIIFAGGSNSGSVTSIEVYNTLTQSWSFGYLLIPRNRPVMSVIANKVYIAGGLASGNAPNAKKSIEVFSQTNLLDSIITLPTDRLMPGAAIIGRKVIVAGGIATVNDATADIYDVVTGATTTVPVSTVGIGIMQSTITVGKYVFIAGGINAKLPAPSHRTNEVGVFELRP